MPGKPPDFKITGNAEIPSEDIYNWERSLKEADFTREEIDAVLTPLSADYRWAKVGRKVEEMINQFVEQIEKTGGKRLTDDQRNKLREHAREFFRGEVMKKSE